MKPKKVLTISMKITNRDELKTLTLKLGCPKHLWDHLTPPSIVNYVALELWKNKTPETPASEELRRQIIHLDDNGVFNYNGWETEYDPEDLENCGLSMQSGQMINQ